MNQVFTNQPYLPSKERYLSYINTIYSNNWLTNNGPLVQELEDKLSNFLGVENVILVSNGTMALELAYKLLNLSNEVITTPFSFVATTSSLKWNNLIPIFSDINLDTLNIDFQNIEKLITSRTTGIVPVHVFGNPCDVVELDKISKKHNLKLIYDASHAFGVNYKDTSILNYGDISTLSFHATKIFHTIEGGALIIKDKNLAKKARYMINFGIKDPLNIPELGINAKMNEFQAAMGLCMIDEFQEILNERKKVYDIYKNALKGIVKFQKQHSFSTKNYSYFPVIFKSEKELLLIQRCLNEINIFPRRYFYPSLDTLDYLKSKQIMRNSRNISRKILCLPISNTLSYDIQVKIIEIIKNKLGKKID